MENCTLNVLPPELRLIIYEEVVGEPRVILLNSTIKGGLVPDSKRHICNLKEEEHLAIDANHLAMTCKEIFNQVMPLMLSTHRFVEEVEFSDGMYPSAEPFRLGVIRLNDWLLRLGNCARYVTKLSVRVTDRKHDCWWSLTTNEYSGWLLQLATTRYEEEMSPWEMLITKVQQHTRACVMLEGEVEFADDFSLDGHVYFILDTSSRIRLQQTVEASFVIPDKCADDAEVADRLEDAITETLANLDLFLPPGERAWLLGLSAEEEERED